MFCYVRNNLKRLILVLIICFFYCTVGLAQAQTQAQIHTESSKKQKGIFSDYLNKAKNWTSAYKNQLEIKYFEEHLKKTPNDVELLKAYAKFLKDHNYYNKAIKIYKRLIVLTKDNSFKKDIDEIKLLQNSWKRDKIFADFIKKAQEYEKQGNIVKANEYYLKAKEIYPERYEAKFGLAKTYCWLNKPKLSTQNYQELLKKAPENIDLLDAYANCLRDSNDYVRAKETYKKLFDLTKNEKYNKAIQDIIALEKGKGIKPTTVADKIFSDYIKQAQKYESQGKIVKANEYYLKAQKIHPERFEAKFGLAKTYGWLGQNKLALAYYKDLLKETPNNRDLLNTYNKFLKASKTKAPSKLQSKYQAQNINAENDKLFSEYIKNAQNFEKEGKAAEANEYYLKAGKIYPSRYEVKFGLAKTYGWLHQDSLAMHYYKELLAQTPDNFDLLSAYANYLKDNKHYSESMEIYNKLLSQTNDEKYKLDIAEVYFLQKDYQTALKLYFDIYNKEPNNLKAQKGIALTYFVSGDFENSIAFYQNYLAQNCDAESVLNYGKSLFYLKHIQQAKEVLEKYVCAYPNDVGGLSTLADIYMATNELQNAATLINRGLSIEPENIKLQTQVARIDISNKDYCRAQCILLNLLAIDPDNVEVVENLGDISFYTQDFAQALAYFQSIPDSPTNPRLIYKIAQAYHYGDEHPAAQYLYYQLLNDPEFSNKSKISLAEIDITDNEPLKARKILNNVLRNDPENIQAKKNLAISFYSTGDNLKSIKILKTLPQDDSDITYNLAKAYNKIERKDLALDLLRDNTQDNAKALEREILTTIRPAAEPFFHYYYMNPPDGNLNAGKYQRTGINAYYYLRPNMRVVGTGAFTQYQNLNNIVSTTATLGSIGLEGKPTNHIGYKSAIAFDAFSNNGNLILGNAIVNVNPNDVVSLTSGYIRSLDEIDSYMSAAGVVPAVGPFANQLVGRIVDNKYVIANIGLKLPHKFYSYWGLNVGNKGGANSPNNFYKEIPAGLGKVIYSGPENRHINQALIGYDFYYTAYTNDRSGFGGANLNYTPIGSDGGAIDPASGFPGVGGYFSPTFFIANKFPITIKGSFRETKLKYVASAFIGTQSIQGQIGLLGPGGGGAHNIRTTPYFGYSIGLRYNEYGRFGWAIEYIFNNYMTVAQHLLRASLLIRF